MSFFIRGGKNNHKKTSATKRPRKEIPKKSQKKSNKLQSEEVLSDSDLESDLDDGRKAEVFSDSETDEETAQEKRLRLAKQYLSQLEQDAVDSEDDELSHDTISKKLKQQFLEQSGRLQKDIAQSYTQPSAEEISILRGHKLSVTCLVVAPDNKHVFTASKDCSIIKWDIVDKKRVKTIPGGKKGTEESHPRHTDHVLALAISTDNKYLVSGDKNKLIFVWNADTCEKIHILKGHRDIVSGLAFRKGSHQLFSASHDRTVKVWDLDEMAYIETLFGHQDTVTGIDSLSRERAITAGGRDGTLRVWKIIEESQLVFNGHSDSIDCVALINEEHFISGAADNSLALWTIMKKKPLCVVRQAHPGSGDNSSVVTENWLTTVTALQHTDLVASGSRDGCIRLWRCGVDYKSLNLLFTIPVVGFVNSLKFSSDGLQLLAGVGQEHRLGRWWRIKEAKNSILIIPLSRTDGDVTTKMKSFPT